jgi:subfamily B ATP-binding cassette protein MsbA
VIYQSPTLAFYGLVVLPGIIYPLSILANKMKKLAKQGQEKSAVLMSILSEIFNNVEIIIANNSQQIKVDKFKKQNLEIFKLGMKGVKANALVSPLMEIVGSLAAGIVIFMGGMEVMEGTLTVGEFFSFMTALFMLYTPIKRISTVYNGFQVAIAANERINNILSYKSEILEGKDLVNSTIKKVEFKNISLKYDDKLALNNINLSASLGEKVALL